jgi:hypothetical protein
MKNTLTLIFAIILLMSVGLGCGSIMEEAEKSATGTNNTANTANNNKSLTDRAVETAVGDEKIGIAECDETMELLKSQANNPDDNFVTKAVKQTALNQFRSHIKQQLDESKVDKKQLASYCRDFKSNLDTALSEEKKPAE